LHPSLRPPLRYLNPRCAPLSNGSFESGAAARDSGVAPAAPVLHPLAAPPLLYLTLRCALLRVLEDVV